MGWNYFSPLGMGNGFFAGFFTVMFLLGLAFYVYWALAMMTIAKKLGYKKSWLAWIPVANLFLIPILAEKKWPWGFLFFVPIVNLVFLIIWMWKVYERRRYPGALSLIWLGNLLPFLNMLAWVANLIVIGLVAWNDLGRSSAITSMPPKRKTARRSTAVRKVSTGRTAKKTAAKKSSTRKSSARKTRKR